MVHEAAVADRGATGHEAAVAARVAATAKLVAVDGADEAAECSAVAAEGAAAWAP